MHDAEHRDGGEIEQHDRTEQGADPRRAVRLDREQPDQDRGRDRDDEGLEACLNGRQTLDRRQHRNGGRDHRIAIEKRTSEDAEQDDAGGPSSLCARGRPADERKQSEAAALALVVGAHDDHHIFDRHHDHHRPEDQAEHASNLRDAMAQLVMAGEGFAEGVDRAGADVAEDDADRADREAGKAGAAMRSRGMRGGHFRGSGFAHRSGTLNVRLSPLMPRPRQGVAAPSISFIPQQYYGGAQSTAASVRMVNWVTSRWTPGRVDRISRWTRS